MRKLKIALSSLAAGVLTLGLIAATQSTAFAGCYWVATTPCSAGSCPSTIACLGPGNYTSTLISATFEYASLTGPANQGFEDYYDAANHFCQCLYSVDDGFGTFEVTCNGSFVGNFITANPFTHNCSN